MPVARYNPDGTEYYTVTIKMPEEMANKIEEIKEKRKYGHKTDSAIARMLLSIGLRVYVIGEHHGIRGRKDLNKILTRVEIAATEIEMEKARKRAITRLKTKPPAVLLMSAIPPADNQEKE